MKVCMYLSLLSGRTVLVLPCALSDVQGRYGHSVDVSTGVVRHRECMSLRGIACSMRILQISDDKNRYTKCVPYDGC